MPMIDVESLNKHFGRQVALNGVSLKLSGGQSVALIGPNGSGKTTLLKCILGLVHPDAGKISVMGQKVSEGFNYRRHLGYMPQIGRFPEHITVGDLFAMIRRMRVDKQEGYDVHLYDAFNIQTIAHKSLGSLSGGMRQQVSAALAFYFDPAILILDEPTAGLDPGSNDQLKKKILDSFQRGKLVITTSHNLGDLDEIANHVVYMMAGEILFSDGMESLKIRTSEKTLNSMLAKLIRQREVHV